MKHLLILNDPPCGTERSYNGLLLANALAKTEGNTVSVFRIGDAASCAADGQVTPNDYYDTERMLKMLASKGGKIGVCGTESLAEGTRRRSGVRRLPPREDRR